MFIQSATNTIRSLGNDLVMKYPGTPNDIERLARFNTLIHGDALVGDLTRGLLLHHPRTQPAEWPYIEDEATGEIVSALCLIPWTWRYEDVTLKAGEMGIVGTLEPYRRKGLIRALDGYFKELLRGGEYDLSHIQGIPYYYRQFGYEYTLPLEGGWQIRPDQIPGDLPANGFTFRVATTADLPALVRWYDEAARDLNISAARSEAVWCYLLEQQTLTATHATTWIVLNSHTAPVGYFRVAKFGFGSGLIVDECSRLSHPASIAAFGKLRDLCIEQGKPYIRLSASDVSPLVRVARTWGAHSEGRYAWQIMLPDVARLLRTIAPVLERRLAASGFAGLSETVTINLYREAFELEFIDGRIQAVRAVGFRPWETTSINIPPMQFTPLVLGYRSREELRACYPDVNVWGQSACLVDALFPKLEAFIYTAY